MSLIINMIEQTWSLLQTLGWWIAVGLVLSIVIQCFPHGRPKEKTRWWSILPAVVGGALLPMCNFAAIPLAITVFRRVSGAGIALAFFCAATLLNPAGILLAYAYMGPELTAFYVCGSITLAFLIGAAGNVCLKPESVPDGLCSHRVGEVLKNTFWNIGAELAFWILLGVLAEAAVLVLAPPNLWQRALLDPGSVSFPESAALGFFHHLCIPDDISLIASLVASGLRPGCAVLFLLMGVCTNLPELFVLWGMAGKKTALLYIAATAAGGIIVVLVTELVIGTGFVPQFNLADAEAYVRLAELFSIRTWMPARIPCAIFLLLLAGRGFWIQIKK